MDLPGFGFAQVSRGMKRGISDLLSEYLANRAALKLVYIYIYIYIGMVFDTHEYGMYVYICM